MNFKSENKIINIKHIQFDGGDNMMYFYWKLFAISDKQVVSK